MEKQNPLKSTKKEDESQLSSHSSSEAKILSEGTPEPNRVIPPMDTQNSDLKQSPITPLKDDSQQQIIFKIPYVNPYTAEISTVNQYFPEYEPLFKYLSVNASIFTRHLENPSNYPSPQKKTSSPFIDNFLQKSIIIASPGHGLFDFLSIFCKNQQLQLALYSIDLEDIIKNQTTHHNLLHQLESICSSPHFMPGLIVFSLESSSEENAHKIIHSIVEVIQNVHIKSKPLLVLFLVHEAFPSLPHLMPVVDFYFQLSLPSLETRKQFLSSLPSLISNNKVDFEHLAHQLDLWNFEEIQNLYLQVQKYFLMDHQYSNKNLENATFTTDYFLNHLISKTFVGRYGKNKDVRSSYLLHSGEKLPPPENQVDFLHQNSLPGYSQSFIDQMYQDAASTFYNDLTLIIDKLNKGILLQTEEFQLLGDFPFILKDGPQKALQKLQKAYLRINQIKNITQ